MTHVFIYSKYIRNMHRNQNQAGDIYIHKHDSVMTFLDSSIPYTCP